MADEVARAFAFMRRGDMAGTREERSPLGTATFDDELRLRYDSNYLLVERETTLAGLEEELVRLGLVSVLLPDAERAAGLADEAARRGWTVHRGVVMVHRRPPGRAADRSRVREVGHEALAPLRRRAILSEHWGTEAVADQLLAMKPRLAERLTARFFAGLAGGEPAAYADLYLAGGEAQIEDVGTSPEHRRAGLGTAVVLTALEEARAAAEWVFLVADAEDWPREWYARLGFDEVGGYAKLNRPVHTDGE